MAAGAGQTRVQPLEEAGAGARCGSADPGAPVGRGGQGRGAWRWQRPTDGEVRSFRRERGTKEVTRIRGNKIFMCMDP